MSNDIVSFILLLNDKYNCNVYVIICFHRSFNSLKSLPASLNRNLKMAFSIYIFHSKHSLPPLYLCFYPHYSLISLSLFLLLILFLSSKFTLFALIRMLDAFFFPSSFNVMIRLLFMLL